MDYEIEIPFGAFDSELMHQEIFIPEGFEATIDGNKIILKKKESEDERIRKELLNHCIKAANGETMVVSTDDYYRWSKWLEKQGTSYTKKDVDNAYVEGMAFAKDELEKQGEQKSVGEEIVEALRTEYEKGRADAFAQMQKEWSKEDEKCIRLSTDIIDSALRAGFCVQLDRDRCVDWFNSIKDRLQPQTKQEWSEEDKDMIQALNACINAAIKGGMNYISFDSKSILIGKVKNWLKSLKGRVQPKNHWKPSKEQVEALAWALSLAKNCGEECAFDLRTLYEQLKKLKGE